MAKKKEPTKEELQREKIAKSFKPGTGGLTPEQKAEFEDMQWRAEHKAIDIKYGLFNPKKFAIRFFQFFAVLWIFGYITQERDRARAERNLEEQIARSKEYARKEAEAKAYRDAQESFRVVQDFYPNGLPTDRKNTPRTETVKIRPVAHGKYPGEYTIEYQDNPKRTVSPEDLLDQIDQEDILDYMDGGID